MAPAEAYPTNLRRLDDSRLQMEWSNGIRREYSATELRKACPCATCREKNVAQAGRSKNVLPVLSVAETAPLRVASMKPVGNYAYNIGFSDGHDSGIFTFDLLQNLGTVSH